VEIGGGDRLIVRPAKICMNDADLLQVYDASAVTRSLASWFSTHAGNLFYLIYTFSLPFLRSRRSILVYDIIRSHVQQTVIVVVKRWIDQLK
jgi:hypothetical protein